MERLYENYCGICTDRGGEGCKLPSSLQRFGATAKLAGALAWDGLAIAAPLFGGQGAPNSVGASDIIRTEIAVRDDAIRTCVLEHMTSEPNQK